MGPLAAGNRTARPPGFDIQSLSPLFEQGAGSSAGLWLGMLAGMLAGVAFVAAVAHAGRAIPLDVQGAVLGALAGLLLAPIFAISSFISMLVFRVLPFSLEGVLGDSIWTRLAKANTESRLGPLCFPFLVLVVLPMAVCGFAGSKLRAVDPPLVILAGLGAILLGLLLGGICGTLLGRWRGPV